MRVSGDLGRERVLPWVAGAGLLASLAWPWWSGVEIRRLRSEPLALHLSSPAYAPATRVPPDVAVVAVHWDEPGPQSAGEGWTFEVFTPPAVAFNPETQRWSVRQAPASAVRPAPWELELVAVEPEPFRLQLSGFFGTPGDCVAAFVRPGTSGIQLARAGHHFADLGLVLERLTVDKKPVPGVEGNQTVTPEATAVLRDEITGREVVLLSGVRKMSGAFRAACRAGNDGGPLGLLRPGDTVTVNASVYRVLEIQDNPAEIVVERQVAGPWPAETRRLQSARPDSFATPAEPAPAPGRPATFTLSHH